MKNSIGILIKLYIYQILTKGVYILTGLGKVTKENQLNQFKTLMHYIIDVYYTKPRGCFRQIVLNY